MSFVSKLHSTLFFWNISHRTNFETLWKAIFKPAVCLAVSNLQDLNSTNLGNFSDRQRTLNKFSRLAETPGLRNRPSSATYLTSGHFTFDLSQAVIEINRFFLGQRLGCSELNKFYRNMNNTRGKLKIFWSAQSHWWILRIKRLKRYREHRYFSCLLLKFILQMAFCVSPLPSTHFRDCGVFPPPWVKYPLTKHLRNSPPCPIPASPAPCPLGSSTNNSGVWQW